MRELIKMIEEMERDLARINWEDVAIAIFFVALVGLGIIGIVVGWW